MGAVIKVRTISSATETAIQLSNAQFGRTLSGLSGWSTLRVGVRWHITNGAIATPTLAVGLCAGTSNMFGDATTTHFVGFQVTGAWTVGGASSFPTNTNIVPCKRVGSTVTTGTTWTQNMFIENGAASATADRTLCFIDIIKGSPNYSFKLFSHSGNAVDDVSSATFLTQMEATTPASTNHTFSAAQTVAVNEGTDGTLDTINVSWTSSSALLEICDIAVARIA